MLTGLVGRATHSTTAVVSMLATPTRDERSASVGGGLLAAWIVLDLIVLAICVYVVRRRTPSDRG